MRVGQDVIRLRSLDTVDINGVPNVLPYRLSVVYNRP